MSRRRKNILEKTVQLKPGQKMLTDSMPIRLQLVEDGTDGGKIVVRGEFARSGAATENKRVYPRELWEREITKLTSAMSDRKMFGELDHPNDGRTSLQRVSHVVTAMSVADNGIVMGEAEVLDTAKGRDLKGMLKAGCKVGVSSRGYGSTRTNEQGDEVVQEDYNLVTFDFVAEPADGDAYPDVYSESKEIDMGREAQMAADQAMGKKFAARVQAEADAEDDETTEGRRAQFEADIIANLGKLSAGAREKIRAEMLADPAVGGAKDALEQIKSILRPFVLPEDAQGVVTEKDGEIGRLKNKISEQSLKLAEQGQQIDKLASMCREATYKYFLERTLGGNPDKALVLKFVGDLGQYEDADALKKKVEAVAQDLAQRAANEAAARAKVEAAEAAAAAAHVQEQKRARKEVDGYKSEVDKLAEALEKTLEANKEMALQLYTESRLRNHPHAAGLRTLVEQVKPKSKEEVEAIIEEHREPVRDADDLEAVRSRVRGLTQGGRQSATGSAALQEERPSPRSRSVQDYNGLGIDLGTLKQLSGLGHNGANSSHGRG
jgi:hypothetical protein